MKLLRHAVLEREPSRLAAVALQPNRGHLIRIANSRTLRAGTARAPISPRSAFTLMEVMVAILILAIALTGLVHGITTALASNKESELQTVAALFAQGKMEELRAKDYLDDGTDEGDCGSMLALYRWRQTVSSTDLPGLHEISVAVEQKQTGREIYTLKTLLFNADDANDSGSKQDKGKDSKSRKKGGRSE